MGFVAFKSVWLAYSDELLAASKFAVEDINLQLENGEFVAIVGPSGCGKSTFMKLATGLKKPSRGEVHGDGKLVTGPLKISGMAFQASSLLPWRTTLATAQAHVVLEQGEAEAGSAYKAVFKVGHGCDGSATRQISVTLPAGFRGAKPTPKPGWTLTLNTHEISWTANTEADQLQDAWYDEFTLRGSLPDQPGVLWFNVRQTCAKGESNWAEIPPTGASAKGLKLPAARLMLTPRNAVATPAHH